MLGSTFNGYDWFWYICISRMIAAILRHFIKEINFLSTSVLSFGVDGDFSVVVEIVSALRSQSFKNEKKDSENFSKWGWGRRSPFVFSILGISEKNKVKKSILWTISLEKKKLIPMIASGYNTYILTGHRQIGWRLWCGLVHPTFHLLQTLQSKHNLG